LIYEGLIIGAGNIGALYDLDKDDKVLTHAKAYALMKSCINLTIADTDREKAEKVAIHYNTPFACNLPFPSYQSFDIVSITTPTATHYSYLIDLLEQNVPVIICEKPVAADTDQLLKLKNAYYGSESKVLVNYMRRFQPGFYILKERIQNILQEEEPLAIIVKYQRGILNNGSHAMDLLEFLFEEPFLLEDFQVQLAIFDAFEMDPTVSGTCKFMNCPVSFVGLTNLAYAVFETELFFTSSKIRIQNSGNEINYFTKDESTNQLKEELPLRQNNLLDKYMVPVMEKALRLLDVEKEMDNFISTVELNLRIVQLIKDIKEGYV
jgi:predicted dehydrogenase